MLDEIVDVIHGRPTKEMAPVSVVGVSIDSRQCSKGDLFFAIRGRNTDGHRFIEQALESGAIAAVVSECQEADGRPLIVVRDTVQALGRLAAYHREQRNTHVIGVTGSNGKTTTKSMIHHILSDRYVGRAAQRSYNNEIGVPLTLLSAETKDDYLVVEVGSNAPGEVATLAALASPSIAVITSIGDAHLAGFKDRNGVAAEKMSLLDHLRPGGLAVLNADAVELASVLEGKHEYTVISFGCCESADVRVTDVKSDLTETTFKINSRLHVSLACPGAHNALNAAAAFAVCRRLNVEEETIVEMLSTFKPLPMRLDVSRLGGLTLIDDSYNANPTSTMAAIDVLGATHGGGRRVFVSGQMVELGAESAAHHRGAGRHMANAGIDLVVAIGDHAPDVISGVHSVNKRLTTVLYADTETACADLPNWLNDSDTVLIKGSRQLQLDRLARTVRAAFA